MSSCARATSDVISAPMDASVWPLKCPYACGIPPLWIQAFYHL